jgi:hypothetical protein
MNGKDDMPEAQMMMNNYDKDVGLTYIKQL